MVFGLLEEDTREFNNFITRHSEIMNYIKYLKSKQPWVKQIAT